MISSVPGRALGLTLLVVALSLQIAGAAPASPGLQSPGSMRQDLPDWVLSGLDEPVTDTSHDAARIYLDGIEAEPLDMDVLAFKPQKLDYSEYVTLTGNQDGWGGCIGRSIIHSLNIIKEMEHPYTPDLSFWYMDARQSQLIKSGVPDPDLTKTLLESIGLSTEATMPSDYDKCKILKDGEGNSYADYSGMPQITDTVNQEAGLYRITEFSNPSVPTVDAIKQLLIEYGPVIVGGRMPIVTGNYVDPVSGTVSSDGTVHFTRTSEAGWFQEYTGTLSSPGGKIRMDGTFTQPGEPGTYEWNATLDEGQPNSAQFWQPSQAAIPIVDVNGKWFVQSNGYGLYLDLTQSGVDIYGTSVCTSCEGHCIAVVGYDDGAEAFKCLNSYGDDWNGNGYFFLPYDKVSENLDSVRYFVNTFSDRSSTGHAYTARVRVTAPLRNKLVVRVGAEGRQAATVWDTPNEEICWDYSRTLSIDVPLPSYAASAWPPEEGQWYVEVENRGSSPAKVDEVTLARLKTDQSCHSVGHFETETYGAESLPEVPAGGTVRIYVKGVPQGLRQLMLKESYEVGLEHSVEGLEGTLTSFIPALGETEPLSGAEVGIYRKADQDCVNMPPQWDPVGYAVTDDGGIFTYDLSGDLGTFAAALLDGDGRVLASSPEVTVQLKIIRPGELITVRRPEIIFPDDPIDENPVEVIDKEIDEGIGEIIEDEVEIKPAEGLSRIGKLPSLGRTLPSIKA